MSIDSENIGVCVGIILYLHCLPIQPLFARVRRKGSLPDGFVMCYRILYTYMSIQASEDSMCKMLILYKSSDDNYLNETLKFTFESFHTFICVNKTRFIRGFAFPAKQISVQIQGTKYQRYCVLFSSTIISNKEPHERFV